MRDGSRKRRASLGEPAAINWERVSRIFGNPRPPDRVWERQFDYNDEALHRLANTPHDEIDFSDLWYYHHDLTNVELQPDLFNYLFPVCLMDWHLSLMENRPCSHGDSEFHHGVLHGNVFEKMLTAEQRAEVFDFFRDSRCSGSRAMSRNPPPPSTRSETMSCSPGVWACKRPRAAVAQK